MKHYYVTAHRKVEAFDEPIPTPGAGEVVVKMAYTALSPGSNVHGFMSQTRQKPGELVYKGSGVVHAVGEGVTRVATGDPVAVLGNGHAEYTRVPADSVHRVPDGLSLREASVSYLCTWSVSCIHLGQYVAAENVVVVGQGLVGASAAVVADMMGGRVLALDTAPDRVAHSRTLGLGAVAQPGTPEGDKIIADYLGERGADLIIETSGSWYGFRLAVDLARDYTRLAIMGIYRQPPPAELGLELHHLLYRPPSKFHYQRLQIIGCGSDPDEVVYPNPNLATRRRNYAYILEQAARGRLPLAKLITNTFQPDEIGVALNALADGNKRMVGVIFDWSAVNHVP